MVLTDNEKGGSACTLMCVGRSGRCTNLNPPCSLESGGIQFMFSTKNAGVWNMEAHKVKLSEDSEDASKLKRSWDGFRA